MELNISEKNDGNMLYDQIPENIQIPVNNPIKVTKKGNKVRFNSNIPETNTTNINETNTKSVQKKMIRPQVPAKKPQVSYDDILSKMGMFVADGQLHLLDNQPLKVQEQIKQQINQSQQINQNQTNQTNQNQQINPGQNSYIYNKYFSNEMQNVDLVRRPKTVLEYRNMLIQDIIQKQKGKQIKSTKLIMPTSNIHFAPYSAGNMNKLFAFSNR
jgi:hypothetical protein